MADRNSFPNDRSSDPGGEYNRPNHGYELDNWKLQNGDSVEDLIRNAGRYVRHRPNFVHESLNPFAIKTKHANKPAEHSECSAWEWLPCCRLFGLANRCNPSHRFRE